MTERAPPREADLALFVAHAERTEAFSDHMVDIRCRHTPHFQDGLRDTLGVLGPLMAAWNTEILFVLRFHGALRFNRILDTLHPISPRVLTDKLRYLAAHGFVEHQREPRHHVYTLTPHGVRTARLLHPLLYYLHNADVIGPAEDPPATDP